MKLDKRKYYLLDNDGCSYYVSTRHTKRGSEVNMRHSKRGNWTEIAKGRKNLKLSDNGNGVLVEMFRLDGTTSVKSLDYLDAWELHYALEIYFRAGGLRKGHLIRKVKAK